jgi:hypothetical protein
MIVRYFQLQSSKRSKTSAPYAAVVPVLLPELSTLIQPNTIHDCISRAAALILIQRRRREKNVQKPAPSPHMPFMMPYAPMIRKRQ